MRNLSAKLLSLLLTALMLLSALPLTASAEIIIEDNDIGGFGNNNAEVEDTIGDSESKVEVSMQDDLSKVEGLAEIIADDTKNIVHSWNVGSTKGGAMTIYTTYTSGTTVDKMFQSNTSQVALMTNGSITSEQHGDLSGGHYWFDSNKQYVEGYVDMTFNFPATASITNFLLASTTQNSDRKTWEYQVFASNDLNALYTETNLLYHYNEDGANTPTNGQYLTFSKPVQAKYFGVRILKGCNPNSADSNRNYTNPRIREVAIIGSCEVSDEFKAVSGKWLNPCLDALDTDYNLLNSKDYTTGDGTPGTAVATVYSGNTSKQGTIRSYGTNGCDLFDHALDKLHADISGANFMDSDHKYIEGNHTDLSIALIDEAVIDKFFISHSTSAASGLRTYEYELYVGNSLDTLYNPENKKWHFVNENGVQNQVYIFPEPVTASFVGVRILKGVMPDCTIPGSSCARIAEIALFGKYNTEYFDYTVTSGAANFINDSGNTYKGKTLSFSAPICQNGYTFRGWKVNNEYVESYDYDIYENVTELTVTIEGALEIEAVYTLDDTEFTSNATYVVSNDKTLIRIPTHNVLHELRYGFDQFPANISAKNGDAALSDKDFLKTGHDLILSSNGAEKQKLSVVLAGDIDLNGAVQVTDVISGIDAILQGNATDKQKFTFDVNNSGILTVSDVVKTRNIVLNTPAEETDYENIKPKISEFDYRQQGRYVKTEDGSVKMDWTASGIGFNADLYGDVYITITQGNIDARYYTAVVDGVEKTIAVNGNNKQDVLIARGLSSGVHSIGFYKQSEGGNVYTIHGININGKVLATDETADLLIEFIGDSITCGAGNMVKDGQPLEGHSQDGYNAYGTVTARLLGADWSNISVSGSSLIDDRVATPSRYHMPTEYNHALKGSSSTKADYFWDFENNRNADIVVVNLGTNDNGIIANYSGVDTSKKIAYFKDLAVDFAKQIIEANGEDVKIVFAFGMMTPTPNFADEAYIQAVEALAEEGFNNAFYCRLPTDKTGGVGHPSVAGDWAAARVLAEFIEENVIG